MIEPVPPAARSAYLHVPFCGHRCGYCDFTLVARRDDLIEPYLVALRQDLDQWTSPHPVDTLFFGGGTPTRLDPRQLEVLFDATRQAFPLASEGEFSVEANPSGLCDDRISALTDAGVTRVSLGVQSFDGDMLRFLERDHDATDVQGVFDRLRSRIPNLSLDLIFGVPGQTLESWKRTLRTAIALEPPHVSTYGLTYEKGTAFWSRREKKQFAPLSENLERDMYAMAMDELADAGIIQYELSNFARPGAECRHNQTYWRQGDYFGHGPGAVRYSRGRREMNHRSVTTWIRRIQEGQSPVCDFEELSPEARAREAVILGLRRIAGVNRTEFQRQTGFELDQLCASAIQSNTAKGLLEETRDNFRLTREGRFLADSVMVDFV